MEEFAAAAELGATLGRREIEQQGDAYRIRAERELKTNWHDAVEDANSARSFYERIPGFDQADQHLSSLAAIHAPVAKRPKPRRYRWQ
jgi:hypothetical protein